MNEQAKRYLVDLSPGAWVHINMLGYYQFCGDNQDRFIEHIIKQWDW